MKKIRLLAVLSCMSVTLCSCSILDNFLNPSSNGNVASSKVKSDGLVLKHSGGEVQNDDIIEIEAFYDYYFEATIDGKDATIKSITAEDTKIILPHSHSVYPRKEGETKLTIVCGTNASSTTYTRVFTVRSIYHGELDSIYVANKENGIELSDSLNVSFTGKVYAKFKNGKTKFINNEKSLSSEVKDGKDGNYKQVVLSYSLNGKTVETSYQVPLNNVNSIERTTLKQGFDEYYKYGYNNIRGHVPNSGNVNVLAIPVWFTDSDKYINVNMVDQEGVNQKQQVLDDLDEAIFGDSIRKNDYSLKKYYEDESFGQLTINGKVSEWYEFNYSSEVNYITELNMRETMLKNAYDWYTSKHVEDSTNYDCVFLLYGSNIYGNQTSYTAFATRMTTTYNGISDYLFASALSIYNMNQYTEGITEMSDLSDNVANDSLFPRTIIHEFAHTLGAIDIYSDSRKTGVVTSPAGIYSMQSEDLGGHDPYHMLAFNYANPYVLSADKDYGTNTIDITFDDMHSSGDVVILTPHWNEYDSPFDEYLVLELYAQTGINYAFNSNREVSSGIRLYHVDSRLFDLDSYELTSDATTGRTVIPFNNSIGVSEGPYSSYSVLNNYQDYELLHLIRKLDTDSKGNKITYETTDYGKEDMWFRKGDKFKMSDFAQQFPEEGTFDDGESTVGWKFEVLDLQINEFNGASATVRFTKDI